MSPEYGLTIADTFKKYLETGDSKLIENYSAKELKAAISQLSPYYNNNKLWFRQIERRIEELIYIDSKKRPVDLSWLARWRDIIIAFGLGLGAGVIV